MSAREMTDDGADYLTSSVCTCGGGGPARRDAIVLGVEKPIDYRETAAEVL